MDPDQTALHCLSKRLQNTSVDIKSRQLFCDCEFSEYRYTVTIFMKCMHIWAAQTTSYSLTNK